MLNQETVVRPAEGNTKTDYLLQGFITCAGCGRLLSRTNAPGEEPADAKAILQMPRLHQAVVGRVPILRPTLLEAKSFGITSRTCFVTMPEKIVERLQQRRNYGDDTGREDIAAAKRDVQKWTRRSERLTGIYVQECHLAGRIRAPAPIRPWSHLKSAEERVGQPNVSRRNWLTPLQDAMADFDSAPYARTFHTLGVDPKTGSPPEDGGPLDEEGLQEAIIRDIWSPGRSSNSHNQLRYELRVPAPKVAITSSSPAWT